MANILVDLPNIRLDGISHQERLRFIDRMQRKLEIKEVLYSDGRDHRFVESAELDLKD